MELVYVDRFIKSKSRTLSENTLKSYESDIRNFIINIIEHNGCNEIEAIKAINASQIEDIIDNSEDARSTINRKLQSLTSFYDYLKDTLEVIEKNPFKNIIKYKDTQPKTRDSLSLEETKKLIRQTYINDGERMFRFSGSRTRFIISLMTTTGMRIEEVTEIRLDFIEKVEDNYFINLPKRLSKNGKPRRIPICGKTKFYYHEYIIEREKLNVDSDLLILSNRKKKFYKQNSLDSIKKYVSKLGIDKNIGNHSFRHTFRTVATSHNVNEGLICCIGGWSRKSLGTQSDVYLHDTKELDNVKVAICKKILG